MNNNVDNSNPQLVRVSLVNKIEQVRLFLSKTLNNLRALLSKIFTKIKSRFEKSSSSIETSRSGPRTLKKYLPFAIIGFFVLVLLGVVGSFVYNLVKNKSLNGPTISILDAKARQELNREFSFPIYDASGKEVNKLKYTIQSAELRDELIADGKRYKSVNGRTFLVLNIKLKNDFKQSVTITTKDYVRLSANGKDEWASADMHNDPVEVDAIATESTRLAFAVNNSDKNLKIKVGEINGEKQEIELELK